MKNHRHTVTHETTAGFAGPVAHRQNHAAHGGITLRQTCTCGATRRVNVNQRHREAGTWRKPTAD